LAFGLFLLAVAVPLTDVMSAQETGRMLTEDVRRSGGDPTEFIGVTMLGGFRGLATDLLWIRAVNLSAGGDYAEMLALTEVIARLQPHQISVPLFQSWTLAYNISTVEASPERRWLWIKSALNLLKESIRKNPDNYDLHFQIAFIYFHRVNWEKYFQKRVLEEEGRSHNDLAIYWLERLMKTKNAQPKASAFEAGILVKTNRIPEAMALIDRDFKRFPDSHQLKTWKEKLAKEFPEIRK
jgi:hypothetical protein